MADLSGCFPAIEVLNEVSMLVQKDFGIDTSELELFTVFAINYSIEG